MKRKINFLFSLVLIGLVSACGETVSSNTSTSSNSSSVSTSNTTTSSQGNYSKTNADFQKASTTYVDEKGVEQNLNMQTLFNNANNPHLDPIENQRVLVVPFGFQDENLKTNVQTQSNIERIRTTFFGTQEEIDAVGGWTSVSNYYSTSSFGKSEFKGDVVNTWCEYNGSSSDFLKAAGGNLGTTAAEYVRSWYISEYAKTSHGSLGENAEPLSYYDQDNDGFIDLIWIVYSINYSQDNTQTWWAYVTYTSNTASKDLSRPNVKTLGWASINFMNDAYNGYDAHTFVHETGHTYGLYDYYDYNDKWSPMGGIDMMDHNLGDHSAFSKFTLGWVNPLVVDDSSIITLRPTTTTGDCFILPSPNYNGTAFDEYIMVEYMSPVGLAKKDYTYGYKNTNGYSDNGIRISHIDARTVTEASLTAENYADPKISTNFRVCNSKAGRQLNGSDTNFFPDYVKGKTKYERIGTANSYALTMIYESNPDLNDNITTSKGNSASNSSLFKSLSRFSLENESNIAKVYMPSKTNLWNKAKTMTGGTVNNQNCVVDESCTVDYILDVLSINEQEARIRVTKIER